MTKTTQKVRQAETLGNKVAPGRFLLFLALLVGGYFAYRAAWPATKWAESAAMAFDAAALVFLGSLIPLLRDSSADAIREHAARNGEVASIVKLVGTLFLIWLFANSVYALHYAHAYYTRNDETGSDIGGIEFPGTKMPGYDDFLYFACTLGMTFQTSDANITASGVRRVALLHSFAAFVFSIGVIAFTINVLGGG